MALAGKGKHHAPSIRDLIIAATAELAGLTVLHVDKDFDLIADITSQSVERLSAPAPERIEMAAPRWFDLRFHFRGEDAGRATTAHRSEPDLRSAKPRSVRSARRCGRTDEALRTDRPDADAGARAGPANNRHTTASGVGFSSAPAPVGDQRSAYGRLRRLEECCAARAGRRRSWRVWSAGLG